MYVYWTVKVYLIALMKSFWLYLTLFSFECLVCYSSTFAMIINLLMGAYARGTHGQQGRDDFAA